MAKTDKTTPLFVVERRGECRRDTCGGGYPCKHISMSGRLKMIRREMKGSERASVRDAINMKVDPPVDQHRHRALWDLV